MRVFKYANTNLDHMTVAQDAQELLTKRKYKEASNLLDSALAKKENDELFYLRGLVSLKLKNYDAAQEFFERALFMKKKAEYYRAKGLAHFEIFEIDEAITALNHSIILEPNAIAHFFLAIGYMLLDHPNSDSHLKKARELDPKRVKQLLFNFYSFFLETDPNLNEDQKKEIVQKIKRIS